MKSISRLTALSCLLAMLAFSLILSGCGGGGGSSAGGYSGGGDSGSGSTTTWAAQGYGDGNTGGTLTELNIANGTSAVALPTWNDTTAGSIYANMYR
jgi:hypothetical protein